MNYPDLLNIELPYKPELVFFQPVWEANNDNAHALVEEVCTLAGLDQVGSAGRKNRIVVASLLLAGKKTLLDAALTIACSTNKNAFSGLANGVGRSAVLKVVDALQGKILERVPGSGAWSTYTNGLIEAIGCEYTYAHVTHHRFSPTQEISSRLVTASFIQTSDSLVEVNESETVLERNKRKQSESSRAPKRMSRRSKHQKFGRDIEIAEHEVKQLGSFYFKHPLRLPSEQTQVSDYSAAVHRVFHNGRLDAGGRFYGPWCSLSSTQRLTCQIDGEAIVSIDINASQPFLFSMLMGIPLNIPSNTWSDLYSEALEGKATKADRTKLKKVALEVIGTGNSWKSKPSEAHANLFNDNEWTEYRDRLLQLFPALHAMDGDYLNGSGFISYHEAEILKQTLFNLMKDDIPAYSVHDCILVKVSDKDHAVATYRSTLNSYVKSHCRSYRRPKRMDCYPAMSVSQTGKADYRIDGNQSIMYS